MTNHAVAALDQNSLNLTRLNKSTRFLFFPGFFCVTDSSFNFVTDCHIEIQCLKRQEMGLHCITCILHSGIYNIIVGEMSMVCL